MWLHYEFECRIVPLLSYKISLCSGFGTLKKGNSAARLAKHETLDYWHQESTGLNIGRERYGVFATPLNHNPFVSELFEIDSAQRVEKEFVFQGFLVAKNN